MRMSPSLSELQSQFSRSIIDGTTAALSPWIAARGIEPSARLQIYRNAVLATQVETLATSFPAVQRLLGEECFDGWATRYAAWHGSNSGNLQHLGHDFAEFLETRSELATLRWLGDLCRLEWLRQRTILAADAQSLGVAALHASLLAAGDDPVFQLLPCVRTLVSRFPVLDLWRFSQVPDTVAVNLDAGPQAMLFWRDAGLVAMQECPSATIAFIRALIHGATLSKATDAAMRIDANAELAQLMAPLLANGLVRNVVPASFQLPNSFQTS
ncbi:MAG: DNA-binding domain-containing protein [Lysobacteraceae bacterium]